MLLAPALCVAQKPSVLAVFAHPDDEVWWGTGTLLAKYAQEGHEVYLVTVTSGQLGVTTHANIPAGPELGAAREEELRCSAQTLGIQPPFAFGFHDQGLATTLVMDEVARRRGVPAAGHDRRRVAIGERGHSLRAVVRLGLQPAAPPGASSAASRIRAAQRAAP